MDLARSSTSPLVVTTPSPAKPKDARVERTRSDLRTALLLLLEKYSFDRITIRRICARAGVGYATYFRHYPDKAALLSDLAAGEVTELLTRALPTLFAQDSRAACVALCGYVDGKRGLWLALLTGGAAGTLREEFGRQSQELPRVQPPDTFAKHPSSKVPVDLAVAFGVSAVVEILSWWLRHPDSYTVEGIADVLDRLVITPILRR